MHFNYLGIQTHPSKQIEDLLNANVIGTPGLSMLYQHQGVNQKLYHIAKSHFVSVYKQDVVVGTCCFCERYFNDATGFYVRYFAFNKHFRLKEAPQQRLFKKSSILRSEISDLLNGHGLLSDVNKTFFHYAYVDPRNPLSAKLCEEFGFITVRKYTTRLFSRISPKPNSHLRIRELSSSSERIQNLLSGFYKEYNHFSFENLNKTYCYIENEVGEIIAGVQVNPDAWRILTMPGKNGKWLLNLFNRLPFLSRLISKNFKFLAVEGIYYKAGNEHVFENLLEALLHRYSINTAVLVVDIESTLHQLTQKINLGLLAKISPEVYGNVIARFQNAGEPFVSQQKSQPSYISVHDLS